MSASGDQDILAVLERQQVSVERDKSGNVIGVSNLEGLGNDTLEDVCRLRTVRELICTRSKVDDAGMAFLARLPALEDLDWTNNGTSHDGLRHLRKIASLRRLVLSPCDAEMIRVIGQCTQLRSLTIFSPTFQSDWVRQLEELTGLETLYLGGNKIGDAGVRSLSRLKSLRRLGIGETGVTDEGLESLRALGKLEWLAVSGEGITDKGLAIICQVRSLQELVIADTRISSTGLRHLVDLPLLSSLSLTGVRIEDEVIEIFARLKLRTLILVRSKISKAGEESLRKAGRDSRIIIE